MTAHIEEEQLQQYFDGELPDKPAALVEQHLSDCDHCRDRKQSLVQLSRMIGMAAEDMADSVNYDNLFHRVELGVREKQAPGVLEQIRVWWDEFVEHQSQVWMPATGALAVAAAMLLTLYLPGTSPGAGIDREGDERVAAQDGESASTIPPEPAANTEITNADFGESTGTVFEIALAEGVSTQVVWINDEDFE